MKTLKTLSVLGLMALLTACGGTKTSTANSTAESQNINRGRVNSEVAANTNTARNSRQLNTENTMTASELAKAEAANKAKMQKMYADLDMSDSQISKFEIQWNTSMNTWRRSNRNKTMNNYERTEYQDNILNNILDETQFENYRIWARDNASTSED